MRDLSGRCGLSVCFLFALSSCRTAAFSVPAPSAARNFPTAVYPLNLSGTDNITSNLTWSPQKIDPDLRVLIVSTKGTLDPIPCLLTAVDAMLTWAWEDFNGFMEPSTISYPRDPWVVIQALPILRILYNLPTNYAIWGLQTVMTFMIKRLHFPAAEFRIKSGDYDACILKFFTGPAQEGGFIEAQSSGALSLEHNVPTTRILTNGTDVAISEDTASINSTRPSLTSEDLKIDYVLNGASITSCDIFLLIFDYLSIVASAPWNVLADPSTAYYESAGLRISAFNATSPARTPSNPPYFQLQYLMSAIAGLPRTMVQRGHFREADMFIWVDGIEIGTATVRRTAGRALGESCRLPGDRSTS